MGSSSSHLAALKSSSSSASSREPRCKVKCKLSHLFCGAFRSKSTLQELEDGPEMTSISFAKNMAPGDPQNSTVESSSVFTSEAGDTVSVYENGDSSERSSTIEETFLESCPLDVQSNRDFKTLARQTAQEWVSGNATDCISAVIDAPDAISEDTASMYPGPEQSTNLSQGLTVEYSHDAAVDYNSFDLRSLSIVSDSLPEFRHPGDDRAHSTPTSSSGLVVSDSDQDLRNGDLLRLDLVSMSSNSLSGSTAEINRHETRRNGMRLFWDALARRSLRRNIDSPTIVLATGLADDLGSHDRWLLDFSGDLHYYGSGRDIDSFSVGLHHREERRWPETASGIEEGEQQSALCASGLHVGGTCSCESFFTAEESSSLASISRIILLAEALFEVLDEIHHQSISALSFAAPESVVDALPLKNYKRRIKVESDSADVEVCHICLGEYEEGEKIRGLPCNHEFHVACIDKWLKEVNRVCPVCRHDVCEGPGECSISNTQAPL